MGMLRYVWDVCTPRKGNVQQELLSAYHITHVFGLKVKHIEWALGSATHCYVSSHPASHLILSITL